MKKLKITYWNYDRPASIIVPYNGWSNVTFDIAVNGVSEEYIIKIEVVADTTDATGEQ